MADERFARIGLGRFVGQAHANPLRSCAAQAELRGQVAAKRARDEEQRLTIFHWGLELAMRARELRRPPGIDIVWFRAAREQDRMPARAAELAFELARADR